MELTIAINNYKNQELLKLCLDSIKKNVKIDYELLVSDSATEEETEMMMREDYPEIKFFPHKKNPGFKTLIKECIEKSSGKYIIFLNGDVIVTENSIENLLDFIKSDSAIGIVGPKLLNFNGTFQYSCFRFYHPMTIIYRRTFLKKLSFAKKHLDWFLMKDKDHDNIIDADWLMGSALMISR